MHPVDRSIIATLAFAQPLGWPLTLMDIHERLVPAVRLGAKVGPRPRVVEIVRRLTTLTHGGTIIAQLGMYALADADSQVFAGRVDREKQCAQKWRRMRRYAWWLQAVPYVRALCASGSLALGNTGPDSDWDVLVIGRTGRLYTARAFLLIATRLMGRLRTKRDSVAPDKFCFNHYLTTEGLDIQHRSLYVAHALAMLIPLHDPDGWLERLRQVNRWTADWVPQSVGSVTVRREVRRSTLLQILRRLAERILDSRLGDHLEARLAAWQMSRIQAEPVTHERGGRVTADSREIEFHPRSAETAVLEAYNRTLTRHGLAAYAARDSGLTK